MPKIIKEIAAHEVCNYIEFIGILDDKEAYSISEIGEDDLFVPIGLPKLLLWDGKIHSRNWQREFRNTR